MKPGTIWMGFGKLLRSLYRAYKLMTLSIMDIKEKQYQLILIDQNPGLKLNRK